MESNGESKAQQDQSSTRRERQNWNLALRADGAQHRNRIKMDIGLRHQDAIQQMQMLEGDGERNLLK